MSVTKSLSLNEFTLWGRDSVSVVRIRESPYYRGGFLKKIYENFVGTLETVCNRAVCTDRFDFKKLVISYSTVILTFYFGQNHPFRKTARLDFICFKKTTFSVQKNQMNNGSDSGVKKMQKLYRKHSNQGQDQVDMQFK